MKPYYDEDGITIYHGDCREILPSVASDVLITDPPYGIALDTDYRRFGERTNRKWQAVHGDSESFDPTPFLAAGRCILFGANYYSERLPTGKWIIWNKRDNLESPMLLNDAEMIWHNCKGRSVQVFNWFWVGCYRRGEMGDEPLHPTQKPLALLSWLIDNLTAQNESVLDPFLGSGTTLLAAKNLGRKAIGIEIEERYCEIAVKRLAQRVLPFEALG